MGILYTPSLDKHAMVTWLPRCWPSNAGAGCGQHLIASMFHMAMSKTGPTLTWKVWLGKNDETPPIFWSILCSDTPTSRKLEFDFETQFPCFWYSLRSSFGAISKARLLIEEALARGTSDNVTCVVADSSASATAQGHGDLQNTGVVKCPMTWVYWTSPYSSHLIDHIPIMESNGWVMFNGDT